MHGTRNIHDTMTDYPVVRPKRNRNDYRGPRCAPGQTPMLCPVERKMTCFEFGPRDLLRCLGCGFMISRKETV